MQKYLLRIAHEGLPLIFIVVFLGWLFALLGLKLLSILFLIISLFFLFFFRDPDRDIAFNDDAILSPADGKIVEITDANEDEFLGENRKRLSIFLSIFDCHINRLPVSGTVEETSYKPGKFGLAFESKASQKNERLSTLIRLDSGLKIVMVQIAGFLARRIVSNLSIGEYYVQGYRFGIIKFGSRVDLYLPNNTMLEVNLGDKVVAGETILGWLEK